MSLPGLPTAGACCNRANDAMITASVVEVFSKDNQMLTCTNVVLGALQSLL
jgi:hypothetical protein